MSSGAPFTSQLSVDGFALCGPAGFVPVKQVMGCCVFWLRATGVGVLSSLYNRQPGKDGSRGVVLGGVAAGYNEARDLALRRLRDEGAACGADAVLDVRVRRDQPEIERPYAAQYVATGTAVRRGDGPRPAEPAVIALPVDEYWMLVQAGCEPLGIAAATVVYETVPSVEGIRTLAGMRYGPGRTTREIPELSHTVSGAVGMAIAEVGERARRLGASDVVGVQIERELQLVERDNWGRSGRSLVHEPAQRKDLVVTVHVLGTAIRDHAGERRRERTSRGTWRDVEPPRARPGPVVEMALGLDDAPQRSARVI